MVDQLTGCSGSRPCDAPSHPVQGLQGGKYLFATALALVFTFAAAVPAGAAPNPEKAADKAEKRAEKRAAALNRLGPDTVIPLRFTDVVVRDGQLVAIGTLGNVPFSAPITFETQQQPGRVCPILHLMLGPIDLNLLGLGVETSEICLAIDAQQGGGLLGDLLCGVAGLLDQGVPLGTILNGLSQRGQLDALLDGILGLVNGALEAATAPGTLQEARCDILNLSLGPVDLNLLGLLVHLDDCDNGPVTVDIFAVPGPGNLLGNLLCGLAGILDGPNPAIARQLTDIADAILDLL
jgi:hypothetical protein